MTDEIAEAPEVNLRTLYMGLRLDNPLVASAGPLSQNVDGILELEQSGVGAIVMYSLFEEQLRREEARDEALGSHGAESYGEATSYFPNIPQQDSSLSWRYLNTIERASKKLHVPLIASLNGSVSGSWVRIARQLVDAGAQAIELNVYFVPGDLSTPGALVEERHVEILKAVKQAVKAPVAVKLSPYFSSMGQMATQLDKAGADALVMFNRFVQPDIDIESVEVKPGIQLSTPFESRLPRTWIAALHGKVRASLAASSGVETSDDVVKYLLAGADVVMTTSALVRHGAGYAATLLDGLTNYLQRKGFASVSDIRGLLAVPKRAGDAYQRAGYLAALEKAKATYGDLV